MKKFLSLIFLFCGLLCACKINVNNKVGSNQVEISYSTTHGTAPKKIVLDKGYVLTLNELVPLECDGYTFEGWYDGIQIAEPNVYIAQKSVTLVAKWTYNDSDYITNVKAVGGDKKITLTWDNPSSVNFTGTRIKVYKITGETVDEFNLDKTVSSYEYECENYIPFVFYVDTLEKEVPSLGSFHSEELVGIVAGNAYFVLPTGSSTNSGKTLREPLDSINTAYSKINSINDGVSEYHIILMSDTPGNTKSLTDSTSYSQYYFVPKKDMNLVIESLGNNCYIINGPTSGRAFYVGANLNLTLNNVIISNSSTGNTDLSSFSGGGLVVLGKLYMNNCEVSKNSISTYTYKASSTTKGGGIYIGGYCELNNTDILNNKCYSSMSDGGAGNYWSAGAYGGGIYVASSGTLIMNGGKISGNTVSKSGSGSASGKGVYVESKASATFNGTVNEDDN